MDDNFQELVSKTLTGLLVNQQEMTASYRAQTAQTNKLMDQTKKLTDQTRELADQNMRLVETSARHEKLLQDLTDVMTVFAESQVDLRKEQTEMRTTLDDCVRRIEALEDKKAS